MLATVSKENNCKYGKQLLKRRVIKTKFYEKTKIEGLMKLKGAKLFYLHKNAQHFIQLIAYHFS